MPTAEDTGPANKNLQDRPYNDVAPRWLAGTEIVDDLAHLSRLEQSDCAVEED